MRSARTHRGARGTRLPGGCRGAGLASPDGPQAVRTGLEGGLMHGLIRRYRVRLGTVEQAAHYADKGFIPILRDIPGFVSCHLLDAGNDILTCMALFETEPGAAEAVRASREWCRYEWSWFRPVPPGVSFGGGLARSTAGRRAGARRRP